MNAILKNFAILSVLALAAGCDNGTEETDDTGMAELEFDMMVSYMAANGMDLPDVTADWIVKPDVAFDNGLETYFIVDVRTGDKYQTGVVDFEEGHLPGAHSVATADVVDYVLTNNTDDKPVLVYCYTGHDATHATTALRLSGVNAQSLMWGMSGWHSDFDLWTGNTGDAALDYDGSWNMDASEVPPTVDTMPELMTGLTTGEEILAARVDAAVVSDLNGITSGEVLANPDDYFVINYWAVEDWDLYGHIAGAYQVAPGTLGLDSLDMLPTDKTIVVYCWTGQTSSMVNGWLQALGYDAKTLKFGANGMIYNTLEAHKWGGSMDYDYDTGA